MRSEFFLENLPRMEDRTIAEFIGIARGLLADGVLNEQETAFLISWLEANAHITCWPFDVLRRRIGVMLADGCIDAQEREELVELLQQLTGGKIPSLPGVSSLSTSLPLTQPTPPILVSGKSFCFTGRFAFGTRKQCEAVILSNGGVTKTEVIRSLDYLVVGIVGNEEWAHSSFGRKIQKAVDYNASGSSIAIISEQVWADALFLTETEC